MTNVTSQTNLCLFFYEFDIKNMNKKLEKLKDGLLFIIL